MGDVPPWSGVDPGGGGQGGLAPPPLPTKKNSPQTIDGSTIVRRGSRGAKGALGPPPHQNPGSAYDGGMRSTTPSHQRYTGTTFHGQGHAGMTKGKLAKPATE